MRRWLILHAFLFEFRGCVRAYILHTKVRCKPWPHLTPGKSTIIASVESLIRCVRRQNRPFVQIAVQHSVGKRLRLIPRSNIAWIFKRSSKVFLHACIRYEREYECLRRVERGADDERRKGTIPPNVMLGAKVGEDVMLSIIEIGFQTEAWIGLFIWDIRCAKVYTVPFPTELDEYPLRQR